MRKLFVITPLFVVFFTGAAPNSTGPKLKIIERSHEVMPIINKVDSANTKATELKVLIEKL